MDMTSLVFEKVHVVEQNSISLSPGSNESQMNFSWYASTEEAGTVLVAKTSQLADGAMPADAQQVTAQSAESNRSGFYSNQCVVTGLEADTEYAYQLVNGSTVSPVYHFTTAQSGAFKFLFVGDPQLGASGDLTSDNSGWASTLAAAVQKVPDAAFLLSAGDQVNIADNEAQYSAYLEQTQLYQLPVATVVGNHDSSSDSYDQHFNVANESSYGRTDAGGDYWFSYNGVLFMVLNVNNMSAAEHQMFMKEAISQNQDASWKVVTMHHSVYSVANHATESDILQRRNELVPIFQALDVDVVLQGHDHVYVRSYMMNGLNPVTDPAAYDTPEQNSVTDTDDILYVTANSASGSKYYEIKNESFPYAAVKSQEHTPTYSEVSVSDSQFRITTYRTNDGSVLDTFAINRSVEEPTVTGIAVSTAPDKLRYTAGENFSAAGMVITASYSDGTSRTVTDYTVAPDRALTADDTAVTISYQGFTAQVAITVTESGGSGSGGSGSSATYVITVKSAANGTISVSHKSAAKNDTVAITVKPDAGYELDALEVLDKNGDKVKIVEKNGKYTFTMPASKVTVEATFVESETPDNPFTDVNEDAYYFDSVLWAMENGVTSGTNATTFAPSAACTRAQTVTFLWRAMGSPEPAMTGNPFSDVAADAYYYKAVLWAVEQGITSGTTATTFSPDATVTRAQTVTFLWRAAESPKPPAENPFADVAADAYYANAVLWAAEENITSGTSATTFSPGSNCTRAQIVTFLWRAMAE